MRENRTRKSLRKQGQRNRFTVEPLENRLMLAVAFNFQFQNNIPNFGFNDPALGAARIAALNTAATTFGTWFDHNATVDIQVSDENTPGGRLAAAGTQFFVNAAQWNVGFGNRGVVGTKVQSNGASDLNGPGFGGNHDGTLSVNWAHTFELGDDVQVNEQDLTATIFHELTHAFGFAKTIRDVGGNAANLLNPPANAWVPFDQFLVDAAGNPIIDPANNHQPNEARWDAAKTGGVNGLFFSGANARAANGGNLVGLFSPNPFSSSLGSHMDDDDPAVTSDLFVMRSAGLQGQLNARVYHPIEAGIMADLGYTLTAAATSKGDEIGVFRGTSSTFYEDVSNDGSANVSVGFGANGDVPLLGDWDGDGDDDIGVFRPGTSTFFLDNNGDGAADTSIGFGANGDTPLVGDWNGDGNDDIGVFRPGTSTFFLDVGANGTVDTTVRMGAIGDVPIVGDWDGDESDDVGVYRPNLSRFFLDQGNNGGIDTAVTFGANGDTPLIGDWNGDDSDDIGVYRSALSRFFLDVGSNGTVDTNVGFGANGDTPIVGDWDGDGNDDTGVYRGASSRFFLDAGANGTVDSAISFGANGDTPLIGNWSVPLVTVTGLATNPVAAEALSRDQLDSTVAAAIDILAGTGLTLAELAALQSVEFQIANLTGTRLGLAFGNTVVIDQDAANYGWFVDETPSEHDEFAFATSQGLAAAGESAASGKLDLLTAVLHELGHILGHAHDDTTAEIMNGQLLPGIRRLPSSE